MSQERLNALLSRIATDLALEDLPDLLHRGLLNIAGADVQITQTDADGCSVLVDLGPVPDGADDRFYRGLLALNLARAMDGGPAFALHGSSRHVVAILHRPLESLEGDGALAALFFEEIPCLLAAWDDDRHGCAVDLGSGVPRSGPMAWEVRP
jgi:hypothetical protein